MTRFSAKGIAIVKIFGGFIPEEVVSDVLGIIVTGKKDFAGLEIDKEVLLSFLVALAIKKNAPENQPLVFGIKSGEIGGLVWGKRVLVLKEIGKVTDKGGSFRKRLFGHGKI